MDLGSVCLGGGGGAILKRAALYPHTCAPQSSHSLPTLCAFSNPLCVVTTLTSQRCRVLPAACHCGGQCGAAFSPSVLTQQKWGLRCCSLASLTANGHRPLAPLPGGSPCHVAPGARRGDLVFIWLVLNNPQLQPVLFMFLLLSLTVYLSSHALSKENPFLTRSCDFPQSQSAALRVDSDVRY